MTLAALLPLAALADVVGAVIGLILALGGAGLILMGLVAFADGVYRKGGLATLFGIAVTAGGLWLAGVIG